MARSENGSMIPDTHAHLGDPAFEGDIDEIIARAEDVGVQPILAVGSDGASSLKAVELARRYVDVYAAVGVHPHEAGRFEEEKECVRALLTEDKVVAVGEIGLDYFRSAAPREVQIGAFRTQLLWARERGLPVSVHNREADADVLGEIEASGCAAILHCFSGTLATAEAALGLGCYISFAGNVTFPRSDALREVAARVPIDRLLVESDAPVLAPQPKRGRRNEPAFTAMTADVVAGVRGTDLADLARAVTFNAQTLFHWTEA